MTQSRLSRIISDNRLGNNLRVQSFQSKMRSKCHILKHQNHYWLADNCVSSLNQYGLWCEKHISVRQGWLNMRQGLLKARQGWLKVRQWWLKVRQGWLKVNIVGQLVVIFPSVRWPQYSMSVNCATQADRLTRKV